MAMMYPIDLRLAGRTVLIVGGGQVAARRLPGLLEAGAKVRVISPVFEPEVSENKSIVLEKGSYAPACLDGVDLVMACTNDPAVNAAVAADAEQRGLWCSVADDSETGDFHVPAVLRQGGMTIAVSTGGASPALAAAVRDRLAFHFGPEWGILIEELARARHILRKRVADPSVRRQILDTLCTDCSLILLTTRDREAWRNWLDRVTEYRLDHLTQAADGL